MEKWKWWLSILDTIPTHHLGARKYQNKYLHLPDYNIIFVVYRYYRLLQGQRASVQAYKMITSAAGTNNELILFAWIDFLKRYTAGNTRTATSTVNSEISGNPKEAEKPSRGFSDEDI